MEFGVGIHGEPGIERRPFENLDKTVKQMFETLIAHGDYTRTIRHWDNQNHQWNEVEESKQALQKAIVLSLL